jgi:hypothetical protein
MIGLQPMALSHIWKLYMYNNNYTFSVIFPCVVCEWAHINGRVACVALCHKKVGHPCIFM